MLRHLPLLATPELRALLCCARSQLNEPARTELAELVATGLDADGLMRAAEAHGLVPLLARHLLGELAADGPPELRARARAGARASAIWSFALAAELIDVLAALHGAGIAALAIKGPVSAALCYGDIGARAFSDLDLLIAPTEVERAASVLAARGYTPQLPFDPRLFGRLVQLDSELLFRHADGRRLVDLHWGLLRRGYSFSPGDDGPFAVRQSVCVDAGQVSTLGTEATLLFLLLHGMKHDWSRLSWLCDVAELLRRNRELDWDALLAWSAPAGRRRFIDIGLLLAHALLDAPVPAEALRRGNADSGVERFATELARRLLREDDLAAPGSLRANSIGLAYFRAMVSPRDRLRFLHDVALRPTLHEWNAVPLPPALAPLHYLTRPVRLALKHARRLLRRHGG
jgi:hypothetical protein